MSTTNLASKKAKRNGWSTTFGDVGRLSVWYSVWVVVVALAGTGLRAEAPNARPQFDVASVRPAAKDEADERFSQIMRKVVLGRPGEIPMTGSDRVRLKDWALVDLIAAAYGVRATEVSGPGWLADEVFDVEATVPEGTHKEELNGMLQSLLEERFGLEVHRSTKPGPGFALVVGKGGPKLQPSEMSSALAEGLSEEEKNAETKKRAQANATAMIKRMQEIGAGGTPLDGYSTASWGSVTMGELAERLRSFAGDPVVDETGLTEKYSVKIETWKGSSVPGGTVFDAVEKLGLRLEPRKVTLDIVVVDRVSKVATPN